MEFLRQDFFNELIGKSVNSLNQTFNFSNYNFSKFDFVNSFLFDKALSTDRTNLLITTPDKDRLIDFFLPTTLIATLHCIHSNASLTNCLLIDDIVLRKLDGKVSTVKEINETNIRILPLGTTKRIELENPLDYVHLSGKFTDKLFKIIYGSKNRNSAIGNFENKMFEELKHYASIISHLKNDINLPLKNLTKTVIVASKNEMLYQIPKCIPYQYMNKSGEVYPDTPFDPLLIVVNDFKTVKEHLNTN